MQFELYEKHTKNNKFLLLVSLLAIHLMAGAAAETLNPDPPYSPEVVVDCALPVEPDEFYLRALAHFDQLQPHTERWHSPDQLQILYEELDRLRLDGLQPQNYFVSDIGQLEARLLSGGTLTSCDARLISFSYLLSVGELALGRLNPAELGILWYQERQEREPEALARFADAAFWQEGGLAHAYQEARPSLDLYQDLQAAHRQIRQTLPASWPEVSSGPLLRPGQQSPRVAELTERLAAQGYLADDHISPEEPDYYSSAIEEAVRAFQRDFGLKPDGLIGPATLQALNNQPATWLAVVRANLERLRWLNRNLQGEVLLVDIAGARVEYRDKGEIIWRGKAQVGRPERKTPELASAITHVTLNPTWTIPPTIFYKDTLPAVQRDPDYLTTHRIRVLDREGRELLPEEIDWSRPQRLILRQDAGEGNALGRVAIRFSNPFSVYLHDTPSVWLFETPSRFYSSGCVRVENAMDLTRTLFRQADARRRAEFDRVLASGRTQNLRLPEPVPLVMAYWTAEGDRDGKVSFRQDIYEEDTVLIDLMEAADL